MPGCGPAFFYIAPYAAYITSSEAYEVGGSTLVVAFALDGVEVLHYGQIADGCGAAADGFLMFFVKRGWVGADG